MDAIPDVILRTFGSTVQHILVEKGSWVGAYDARLQDLDPVVRSSDACALGSGVKLLAEVREEFRGRIRYRPRHH